MVFHPTVLSPYVKQDILSTLKEHQVLWVWSSWSQRHLLALRSTLPCRLCQGPGVTSYDTRPLPSPLAKKVHFRGIILILPVTCFSFWSYKINPNFLYLECSKHRIRVIKNQRKRKKEEEKKGREVKMTVHGSLRKARWPLLWQNNVSPNVFSEFFHNQVHRIKICYWWDMCHSWYYWGTS